MFCAVAMRRYDYLTTESEKISKQSTGFHLFCVDTWILLFLLTIVDCRGKIGPGMSTKKFLNDNSPHMIVVYNFTRADPGFSFGGGGGGGRKRLCASTHITSAEPNSLSAEGC